MKYNNMNNVNIKYILKENVSTADRAIMITDNCL